MLNNSDNKSQNLPKKVNTRQGDYFATDQLENSLGSRSVRGGVSTLLGQMTRFFIQTITTVILARLLAPADFGLIAMIMAVTSFLTPLQDFGLSTVTLQKAEINHVQVTNLFWINTLIGMLLALGLTITSPLISYIYAQPILTVIIIVFSIKFILEGISFQHQALLRRQMRYGSISIMEVGAMTVASLAAIFAAREGFGHWALVIQQLTLPLVIAVCVWLICPWRPGTPSRDSGLRPLVTFGGQLTGSSIFHAFAGNVDNVLIGWRWGASALGLYSRSNALLRLPLNQITFPLHAVAIASLSRLQNEPDRYRSFYCRMAALLAITTTPVLVAMTVLSKDIIFLLLGDQWMEAGPIFAILAIAALGQPVGATIGLVYASLGQANRELRWTLFTTPLTVLALFLGLPWGAMGVAIAYAISVHVIRFPALWYAYRYSPIKISNVLKAVWRPFAVSALMYVSMACAQYYLDTQQPFERVIICCSIGGITFAGSILLWPETRRETISMMRHVIELWRQSKSKNQVNK
jgi:O-antigen/teichoic acid export membrane protein